MFLTKQELKELLISESKATLNINIKFEGELDLATTSKNIKQTRTTMAYHKKQTTSVDNKGILCLLLHYLIFLIYCKKNPEVFEVTKVVFLC